MDGERWLTVAQAAELIQIHPETLRGWLRAGRFPGTMPGGRRLGWRIRRSDVERFLSGELGAEVDDPAGKLAT